MSYATLLWGVFEIDTKKKRERLIAVASSKSAGIQWRRDIPMDRTTRVRRFTDKTARVWRPNACLSMETVRGLGRWHPVKKQKKAPPSPHLAGGAAGAENAE